MDFEKITKDPIGAGWEAVEGAMNKASKAIDNIAARISGIPEARKDLKEVYRNINNPF